MIRRNARDVLAHPRRQRIHDHLALNPGINFRRIGRDLGIPTGSVGHHLSILGRAGLVLSRRHGQALRFFAAAGHQDEGWRRQVASREPALRLLLEWVAAHPQASQREILAAMASPRSSTQNRLGRLVAEGLLDVHPGFRSKRYAVRHALPPAATPTEGPVMQATPGRRSLEQPQIGTSTAA